MKPFIYFSISLFIYFVIYKVNVNVYIIDSAIDIYHREFIGRASIAYSSSNCTSPVSHGTHVAGIIGGYSVGVTSNVYLHSVNVIDCNHKVQNNELVNAIDWIIKNHQKPAIINMALIPDRSGEHMNFEIIPELDRVIKKAIDNGIIFVSSAGNDKVDRCNSSPATVKDIILVGSISDNFLISSFSNRGDCITVFTNGENILSSIPQSKYEKFSGTSQATPYITGLLAQFLFKNPKATQLDAKEYIKSMSFNKRIQKLK